MARTCSPSNRCPVPFSVVLSAATSSEGVQCINSVIGRKHDDGLTNVIRIGLFVGCASCSDGWGDELRA